MSARYTAGLVVLVAMFAAASIWPVRSRHLFSWDSANYAFGVARIDIAAHRPHPPGYLGYIFAARALDHVTHDVNTSLVAWNVLIIPVVALVTALLGLSMGLSRQAAVAAAGLVVTSPLVWFYASVAEIYVTELLWAVTIAWLAHLASKGHATAIYGCAAALAVAAVFKPSTPVLMLPTVAYAWFRSPSPARWRALLLLAMLLAIVAAVFLTAQPGYLALVWAQFTSATNASRLTATGGTRLGVMLNRNARDTLMAFLAALGVVNTLALIAWATRDRRTLDQLDRRFVLAWVAPWLFVFLGIHIGKPGYVLPVLPSLFVILAGFYSRLGRGPFAMAIAVTVLANVLQVGLLTPSEPMTVRYRDRTFAQRLQGAVQPLTFPTLATLRTSDRLIDRLGALRRMECPSGEWIVAAGTDPIDWRRAMYYEPSAQVVRWMPSGELVAIGRNGDFENIAAAGAPVASDCGLLWIGPRQPVIRSTAVARVVDDIGWLLPPGAGVVTPQGIEWTERR